jgi:uncharacterized protein YecE (DUF72 family)
VNTQIRLGTSSFTADGWNGAFYTKGMKSVDYLSYYSSRFDTVEVDSTFYRSPTIEAVRNWALSRCEADFATPMKRRVKVCCVARNSSITWLFRRD